MSLSAAWDIFGILLALATLPGTLELLTLTAASLFWKSDPPLDLSTALNLAVVIPAHNEEASIQSCLESLQACGFGANRVQLVVVADNCTDRTASIATQQGARVIHRDDTIQRGKGFALSFAFGQLVKEPFDAFIILDADTLVEKNFIHCFAERFSRGAMAVQCRYLPADPGQSIRAGLMNLALLAFHVIRPRGRSRLGFSAGIFGNGFGLSRRVLETTPYAPGSITEDLEYHVSLVRSGHRVLFEDRTTVRSLFPEDESAASVQRSRWEGGRFRLMRSAIPVLLQDLFRGKRSGLEALFDLLTLPLAFHVTLVALTALAFPGPVRGYACMALAVVGFHVISAIATAGGRRDAIALLAAPVYMLWKIIRLPFIFSASRKNAKWIRTPRKKRQKEKTP
jgi:cellulose synthase/poly-beta-1,6-N-acetylglucosamine synthase-like glycosyltransferase